MKLKATIKAYGDPKKIHKCFKPETFNKKRSSFTVTQKENCALFKIEAKDSVALRATLNGITKLLTVYEKTESIKNGK